MRTVVSIKWMKVECDRERKKEKAIEWCSQYRLATEYGIAVDIEGGGKLRDVSDKGEAR